MPRSTVLSEYRHGNMIRCMAIDGLLFLVQLNDDMTFVKHHRVFSLITGNV